MPRPLTIKIDPAARRRLENKARAFDRRVLENGQPVVNYLFQVVGEGYKRAAVSGMGAFGNSAAPVSVAGTLDEFLGQRVSVKWDQLATETIILKEAEGWELGVWAASGETRGAVKAVYTPGPRSGKIFAGIDSSSDPQAAHKANQAEFGGVSDPGDKPYEGRALFTLLNDVFAARRREILTQVYHAVIAQARQIGWGRN